MSIMSAWVALRQIGDPALCSCSECKPPENPLSSEPFEPIVLGPINDMTQEHLERLEHQFKYSPSRLFIYNPAPQALRGKQATVLVRDEWDMKGLEH